MLTDISWISFISNIIFRWNILLKSPLSQEHKLLKSVQILYTRIIPLTPNLFSMGLLTPFSAPTSFLQMVSCKVMRSVCVVHQTGSAWGVSLRPATFPSLPLPSFHFLNHTINNDGGLVLPHAAVSRSFRDKSERMILASERDESQAFSICLFILPV